tara:strand:- start:3384 stop:4889 length:1506 start_codon:yes stop_codon:yes gene_type:complete
MANGDPNNPLPNFTPAPVPFGYGQMQGMPALSRNPNYGVPSGIGSLLGGMNPMMAPQAGAFLTPQMPVSTNALAGTNPFTGGAFQTFTASDVTQAASDYRANQAELLRQAEAQAAAQKAAAEAAAKAEADRIAAEQAAAAEAARIAQEQEAARIAAEQAAAAAEAERIAQEQAAAAEAEAKAKADAEAAAAEAEKIAEQKAIKAEMDAKLKAEADAEAAAEAAAKIASGEIAIPTREEIAASIRPSTGIGGDKGGPGGVLPSTGTVINPGEPSMMPGGDFIPFVPPVNVEAAEASVTEAGTGMPGKSILRPGDPGYEEALAETNASTPAGLFSGSTMGPARPPTDPGPLVPISSGIPPGIGTQFVPDSGIESLMPRRGEVMAEPAISPIQVAAATPGVLTRGPINTAINAGMIPPPPPPVVRPPMPPPPPPPVAPPPVAPPLSPAQALGALEPGALGALFRAEKPKTPPKPKTQKIEKKPKTRKKQQPKKRRGRRGAGGRR